MKRVCLVVGHEPPPYPPNDPGAVSLDGLVSEWTYNNLLADNVKAKLMGCRLDGGGVLDVVKVLRDPDGYNALPEKVNAHKPDFVVSMHLNGFRLPSATGTEVLYWHTSKRGREIAATFIRHLEPALGLRLRGDGGLVSIRGKERGWWILSKTNAPAVLVEPGFVTTPSDLIVLLRKREALTEAYAGAIREIANAL